MQNLTINKGSLKPKILIPPSKSYANRALIVAAVKKEKVGLKNLPKATDVSILIDCLKGLGLNISQAGDVLTVENSFPACESNGARLEVGEGGTTARFLAGMLLLGSKPYELILGERLKERPWDDFIIQVRDLGGKVSLNDNILTIQGPIKFPETLKVDCSKTTQFATAFQLIAPERKKVIPENLNSSVSYWKMTEKILEDILASDVYDVPLDWSSASYPLAFGALNHKIELPGLRKDEFQADSKFVEILQKYNSIKFTQSGAEVFPGSTSGDLQFEVSDALDLVPTLAYYLGHIKGVHKLTGIENLVHKESDRLGEVIKLLAKFDRKASTDGQTLIIEGRTDIFSGKVNLELPNDHRMVMVGTLFLLHHNGGTVFPPAAVTKSYPDFFETISS
jgi:3-phosphoshikimate 1-carboxyvinyltransferase